MIVETNRQVISRLAGEKEEENYAFREYLITQDADLLDNKVHELNKVVSEQIDCTSCGACCRNLMINVSDDEIFPVAASLEITEDSFKQKYIEQGETLMIMNTIPCHFLSDNKCSIYLDRFNECREFPHLHKPNFKGRLFGTLMHYGMCPIVYNVLEELKMVTEFTYINESYKNQRGYKIE